MTKKLKETYDANPSEWIVVVTDKHDSPWEIYKQESKPELFVFDSKILIWKLIHIKHKQVLEAYLADDKVEIEFYLPYVMCTDGTALEATWEVDDNFIENYNPDLDYRIKEKEDAEPKNVEPINDNIMRVSPTMDTKPIQVISKYEQAKLFEFIKHGDEEHMDWLREAISCFFSGEELPIEEKEDGAYTSNNISSVTIRNDDSDNMAVNSFTAHGFEVPDFAGEILKEVDGYYVGYVITKSKEVIPVRWCNKGYTNGSRQILGLYITPIKKKWYEDAANFPCLIQYNDRLQIAGQVAIYVDPKRFNNGLASGSMPYEDKPKFGLEPAFSVSYGWVLLSHARLATKSERDSLYAGEE